MRSIWCFSCLTHGLDFSVSPFPFGRDTFPGPVPIRPFALKLPAASWAVIAFLLLLVSLSNDSIDMLESQTWDYARHDTFVGFCRELQSDAGPESQMPLSMFSFWAWARVFGSGELALRSLNLVWAAIALGALARVGRQISIPWLPMVFAIHPFVWYYMNYARTPIMQMAGGALMLAGALGIIRRISSDGPGGILLCLGAVLLSGANMFGLVPMVAVVIGLTGLGIWKRMHLPLKGKIAAFTTGAIVAVFVAYYILIQLRGTGGSQLWTVSPANVLFATYEFLGFQGLGPGRQELRVIMKGLVSPLELLPFVPGFLVFCSAYILILIAAFKSWLTRELIRPAAAEARGIPPSGPGRSILLLAPWVMGVGVPVLSAMLLYALATASGMAFWGRHLAGAFPFWILALGITVHWARQGIWRKAGRRATLAILFLLLASSLLIRFAPWHKHDDYRGAVAEAVRISSGGGIIWWVADHSGGTYYGLPLAETSTGAPGEIQFSMNRQEFPEQFPAAIIVSRRDNFDTSGHVARVLAAGSYKKTRTLQAFEVWEK